MHRTPKSPLFAGVAALALLASPSLEAVTIAFNTGTQQTGSNDNQRTFTDNGHTVVTSAEWTVDGGGPVYNTNADIRLYSAGLGVINPNENSGSPQHTVDNHGSVDRVVFDFQGTDVILNAAQLNVGDWGGQHDTDISIYYIDSTSGEWTFLENDYNHVAPDNAPAGQSRSALFNFGDIAASTWAISSLNPNNGRDDEFKIGSIGFEVASTPPGGGPGVPDSGTTLAMFAVALGSLRFVRKKSKKS